ncbi:MerR family transcriptional regulator [Paenibacillus sediminis]|uniref:DNA-binding transcriptional MerR regulator n=1 Tax=Paenibacillus sediminis TaxID=664909 RepID=A0ABS4H5D7_9BACL|nr:MerR family transcriptional regulator [Paenibacillus sediminis]MBP1937739.1 DNA-binding transcriptional MerR regulator [Paenibacillus sediminis]
MKLYRIGELAKAANISERTIDYYTKLGLIQPEKRSQKNYRLYSHETLLRLQRINQLKHEKYTLEEIKSKLDSWTQVTDEAVLSDRLTSLEIQMQQLEREFKEIGSIVGNMKPSQAKLVFMKLLPQSAACIEAIRILFEQGPPMM